VVSIVEVPVFLSKINRPDALSILTDVPNCPVSCPVWFSTAAELPVNILWKKPNANPMIAIAMSRSRIVAITADIPFIVSLQHVLVSENPGVDTLNCWPAVHPVANVQVAMLPGAMLVRAPKLHVVATLLI